MTAPDRPSRPEHRRPARPKRRARWGLRLASVAAGLVLAAAGVGHAVLTGLESHIKRVNAFDGLSDRPRGSDGTNILVVGTDGRDRITEGQRRRYRLGGAPCRCTDTIMLVHLSGDRDRASVVSLPRDTYAEIPAYTDRATGKRHPAHPRKINAAYAEGGPSLTVRTVEHMTGVHIDHYLEVDFASFMKTVDAVGGVRVCTARPLRDSHSGLDLAPGSHTLHGGQALQYVRSRHLDAAADLGRMSRQQRFLAALLRKATDSGLLLNPVRFTQVASGLLDSVRADRGFGTDELMTLGRALRHLTPASSEFASVPVSEPSHPVPGVGSTVRWDRARAARLFQAIRQDRPLAEHAPRPHHPRPRPRPAAVEVPPGRIRVQVFNGAGTRGLGHRVDQALRRAGFATTGAPADAARQGVAHTVISYDPGWDRSARSLRAALPGALLTPAPRQGPVLRVTVGTDYRGVRPVRTDPLDQRPAATGYGALTGDQVDCQ
ncbi:LCP family protein [Streptomyces palmae]|uniref:LytR family transcriptional regulator n=1 Tax=Streptomyces palmae TaxID=1701085 RepID=A0A4Z0GRT7_9ACTN|nr:LCP family protein [Streptomyces palmae]TGA99335.1 LytR family transcriptional regulator [Streptomyces palmae]